MWVMVPVKDAELPALADAVRRLHEKLAPAKPRRILEIIYPVLKRHRQDQRGQSDSLWEAQAHEYVEDLKAYSEAHILAALAIHRRSSRFMPHQSELIEICEGLVAQDKETLRRGMVLLGQRKPLPWERLPDTAPVKSYDPSAALQQLAEKMKAGHPQIAGAEPRVDTAPKPVDVGRQHTDAAELRATIARRAGQAA